MSKTSKSVGKVYGFSIEIIHSEEDVIFICQDNPGGYEERVGFSPSEVSLLCKMLKDVVKSCKGGI